MHKISYRYKQLMGGLILAGLVCFGSTVEAQESDVLDRRVTALEEYVETIPSTLNDFSDHLQQGMAKYAEGLDEGLEHYSVSLQEGLDERIQLMMHRKIVLNPTSSKYQRIDTNSGVFLISVEKIVRIREGYRLSLNVGNPNFADYRDFKITMMWGAKRHPDSTVPYAQWRASLVGATYTFNGALVKGKWNQVEVDLVPADSRSTEHIECSMEISGVELDSDRP